MQAPKIPSSWNECSWEKLVEIYRHMGEYSDRRSVRNLHIWLFLAELVFADGEVEIADDLSLYLDGSHYVNGTEEKLPEKLRRKVEIPGALDWVDELVGKGGQGGLTQLPIDTITIGKKQWRLPSALITNFFLEHIEEQPFLLDILIQHLQSSLGVYKTQFPEPFFLCKRADV